MREQHILYRASSKKKHYVATVQQKGDGSYRFIPPYPETGARNYKTKSAALKRLKKEGAIKVYDLKEKKRIK